MNKLKYYRKKNKYNQKEIAKYLKVSQPTYSNIENTKKELTLTQASYLAKLYKITISNLIDDDESVTISKEDYQQEVHSCIPPGIALESVEEVFPEGAFVLA